LRGSSAQGQRKEGWVTRRGADESERRWVLKWIEIEKGWGRGFTGKRWGKKGKEKSEKKEVLAKKLEVQGGAQIGDQGWGNRGFNKGRGGKKFPKNLRTL